MLSTLVSLGLGIAADTVLSTAAKAALPAAKTIGSKIVQRVGCAAISVGVGYAIDKMIEDTARDLAKAGDCILGIEVIEREET